MFRPWCLQLLSPLWYGGYVSVETTHAHIHVNVHQSLAVLFPQLQVICVIM
jgi:hypothetical protein